MAALLATLAGPLLAGPAGWRVLAHAQLVTSSPAAGSILAEAPDELRLVFSEPLEPAASSVDVIADDGRTVISREGTVDPDDPFALVVADPGLADGVYQVRWRNLSTADGHTLEGTFTFGIGVSALPADAADGGTRTEADAAEVVTRTAGYPGLLLAVGVPLFSLVVLQTGRLSRTARYLIAAAMGVSALAALILAALPAFGSGADLGSALAGRTSLLHLARAALLAAGAVAVVSLPPRWAALAAAVAGLVGIVLLVSAGHASAVRGPVAILAHAVHVAAVAVWLGGLVSLLALILRPSLVLGDAPRSASRRAVPPAAPLGTLMPRFSALALASVGLAAMTGIYAAWVHTGTLLPIGTSYGQPLLLKAGLVGVAMALGGLNYIDGGRVRAKVATWLGGLLPRIEMEAALLGVALFVTAILAVTQPTDAPRGTAIEPVPDAFGRVVPSLEMELVPGRPGLNRVVVGANDALTAGSLEMFLALDRLDTGASSRVPLNEAAANDPAHAGHGIGGGAVDGGVSVEPLWVADALLLPAGGTWNVSVVLATPDGSELSRQRFGFEMGADGLVDGAATSVLDPALAVAAALALGGILGAGLGLGGFALPRCDPAASRVALIGGGTTAAVLGAAIGLNRLIG